MTDTEFNALVASPRAEKPAASAHQPQPTDAIRKELLRQRAAALYAIQLSPVASSLNEDRIAQLDKELERLADSDPAPKGDKSND